ncbi:MAG: PH domain-containing protein [Angelakisella sp.]
MTVLEAVEASGTGTAFWKGAIKSAQQMLTSEENVIYALTTNAIIEPVNIPFGMKANNLKNKTTGVVVITSKRLIFCHSILGQSDSKQIDIANIQSIDDKVSILNMGTLRIVGITEVFIIDNNREQIDRTKVAIEQAMSLNRSTSVTTASNTLTPAKELEKLKKLLDSGAIDEMEYKQLKQNILNKL